MRNLILSDFKRYHLTDVYADVLCTATSTLYVYSGGNIVCCQGDTGNTRVSTLCAISDLHPIESAGTFPKAANLSLCYEKDTLYLFLKDGTIVSVEAFGEYAGDVVGNIDSGIQAVCWSPGDELVALVTGAETVLVMTSEFDPVSEVPLHSDDFGEKQFITVGWGKRETQFRGSEGKLGNKQHANPNVLRYDDGIVRITWRGDAQYFAVSCINPETQLRYVRIFSREGVVHYTSEHIPGLESAIHWQPSGALIATTERHPNKHGVTFLEKNGLVHGSINLLFQHDKMAVKELKWSPDSKLLAIHLEEFVSQNKPLIEKDKDSAEVLCQKTQNTGMDSNLFKEELQTSNLSIKKIIQVYTMKNYHWYCKFNIDFSNKDELVAMEWDILLGNTLHVMYNTGNSVCHETYTWQWAVCGSKGADDADAALVAVVDGTKVLVTSFRDSIIPPPMSSYTIQLDLPVNAVNFIQGGNDMFIQLINNDILLYQYEKSEVSLGGNIQRSTNHKQSQKFNMQIKENSFMYNLHWVSRDSFAYCQVTEKSGFHLCMIKVDDNGQIHDLNDVKINAAVALIAGIPGPMHLLIHDNAGQLHAYSNTLQAVHNYDDLFVKDKLNLTDMDIVQRKNNSFWILGLDKSNRFYMNTKMVANNVTSFVIHEKFLLLTTLKHELLCIDIEAESEASIEKNVSRRRLERGSRLVRTVPRDTKVILQMPRGNLECIQPRALSFSVIGNCLDSQQYHKAFDIMRRERINLNVLFDSNPDDFVSNIQIFLTEIKNPSWISLFLADLSPEDVTTTMYSDFYKSRESRTTANKVQVVCELIEKALKERDNADEYLLPILTTHLKRNCLEHTEKALLIIKGVKERELKGDNPSVTSESALNYVLYLANVEELYQVALGLYDFDLAMLLASKSHMDPKEYLAFLNRVRKLEVNYQHFTIDKHLKRYDRALASLVKCDADITFDECLQFIKTHGLFKLALQLIPSTSSRFRVISDNYGDELLKKNCFEDAASAFFNCGLWRKATEAFKRCGRWEDVIYCAQQANIPEHELTQLYTSLALEMINSKRFQEAATIYKDYLSDVQQCLDALCCGKLFGEAFRIAHLNRKSEVIATLIKPGILEHHTQLKSQISSNQSLYNTQKCRLATVRAQKTKDTVDAESKYTEGEQDMYSETSTVVTQSYTGSHTTVRSFRSSKNRRKHERKMLSLKEGSPHEDLALMTSLSGIITNSWGLRAEVRDLNRCLLKINHQELAEELQKQLSSLINDIERTKSEIWVDPGAGVPAVYGPQATSNSIASMFQRPDLAVPVRMLKPELVFPPTCPNVLKWELDILN